MKYFFVFVFCLTLTQSRAQVGKPFPIIETVKISGEIVSLPDRIGEGFSLIGMGRSKKAEEALRSWQTPVYNKFVAKTGLMDDMFDVEIYFLPIFTGASRAAKGKIMNKLRENNDPLVMDHVYIYSGNSEPFDVISLDDKSEPCFVLVDEKGKIVWSAHGSFKQKYLDEIEDILIDS